MSDELFDKYGARRMQLEMALASLMSQHAEEIVGKIVRQIIEEDLDPVSVELAKEMCEEFMRDMLLWHIGQGNIPEPKGVRTIKPQGEDGPELTVIELNEEDIRMADIMAAATYGKEEPQPEEDDEEEPEEEPEEEEEWHDGDCCHPHWLDKLKKWLPPFNI